MGEKKGETHRVSKMSFTQENSTQKCLVAVKEGKCEVPAEPDTISAQHPTW